MMKRNLLVCWGLFNLIIMHAKNAETEGLVSDKAFNDTYNYYVDQYKSGEMESISGPGSTLAQTAEIRRVLPDVLQKYNIQSLLDAPCGDFNWMRHVQLGDCAYYGIDIVKSIIDDSQRLYGNTKRIFMHKNLITEELPEVDLIVCRDCLVHFSFEGIWGALRNFKKSNSRYLLTTTFTSKGRNNVNISTGGWQALNLQKPPFNFPEPLLIINEHCTEQNGIYGDKSLALWDLAEIDIPC